MKKRLLMVPLAIAMSAQATDHVTIADAILEIPGVASFTDQRGNCPRTHRVAIAPDGVHGCYTMGEHDRRVTIEWPDGSSVEYSEIQFEIYSRRVN